MLFADFSPPSSPSLELQRDALRKGLGRAMQWATTRQLDDDPLLEACLIDKRYDRQIEDSRGDRLWRMIQAVGAADRFRVPILHALYALSDEESANQLCELARCYSEAGDETFRMRLYEIVERKPIDDSHWLGEEEIIRLDGEKGFLFAAQIRGERSARREWEWEDESLIDHAIERFGEGRVNELMEDMKNPTLQAYWQAGNVGSGRMKGKNQAIRIENVCERSQSKRSSRRPSWAGPVSASSGNGECTPRTPTWGRSFEHLSAPREAKVIADLLRVFSNRSAPRFVARFIELCRHPDPEVRRRAIASLENIEHPLVRELALSKLQEGTDEESVIGLFIKNYQVDDERRILEAVEVPVDESERHGLMMDVVKVLEANSERRLFTTGGHRLRFHPVRELPVLRRPALARTASRTRMADGRVPVRLGRGLSGIG